MWALESDCLCLNPALKLTRCDIRLVLNFSILVFFKWVARITVSTSRGYY